MYGVKKSGRSQLLICDVRRRGNSNVVLEQFQDRAEIIKSIADG